MNTDELCTPMSSYNSLTCSLEDLKRLKEDVFIKEENADPTVCLLERSFGSGDEEHCPLAMVSTSLGSKKGRKRKVDDENRKFQESWTRNYFFIEDHDKRIVCLICNGSVAVPKVFNLKRHYTAKHKAYEEYQGSERLKKIRSLIQGYYLQHNDLINKSQGEVDDVTEVSCEIAYLIARGSRPFTDGNFAKDCLIASAKKFCPNILKKFESVDLDCNTLQGHALNLSNDVVRQLRFRIGCYAHFSLAISLLEETKSTSHLVVLMRGVTPNFAVDEEVIGVRSIEGYVGGNEIFTHVMEQCNAMGLDMTKLSGVVTSGSPVLVNPFNGVVPLLVAHLGQRKHELIIFDTIIDYRLLFGIDLQFDYVMKIVVEVIKYIKLNGMNNPMFKAFIDRVEVECGGVDCYSDVWWWIRSGSILRNFVDLLDELGKFFAENGGVFPDLKHPEWLCDLAFLVDITSHLNTLDSRLRGRDQLASQLLMHVTAFQHKLELFHTQLHRRELHHFPTYQLMLSKLNHNFHTEKYFGKIGTLKEIFHNRFHNLQKQKLNLQLFSDPFTVSPDEVTPEAQLELIDLQNSIVLRSMFIQENLLNFYKYLSQEQYPYLSEKAAIYSSLLGSTFCCEESFNVIRRMLKQENRVNLQSLVRLATTNLVPRLNNPNTDYLIKQWMDPDLDKMFGK